MDMADYLDIALTPDVDHCGVNNVGKGGLGIIGDGFAESSGVIASAEEPTLASHE